MDFRELLKKYMAHVGEEEGTFFLPAAGAIPSGIQNAFTAEEAAELQKISTEL